MTINDLVVGIGDGKKAEILFLESSVTILGVEGEDLSMHELNFLQYLGALYVSAHLKGIIPDYQDLALKAHRLYFHIFNDEYEGFRGIEDMSLEDFQVEMRKYNGRE